MAPVEELPVESERLRWILRVLDAAGGRQSLVSAPILRAIGLSVDVLGSGSWRSPVTDQETSGDGVQAYSWVDTPAAGEIFMIHGCSAHHTDPGGNHTLSIEIIGDGRSITVAEGVSLPANQRVVLPRPVILPFDYQMRVQSEDVLPATRFLLIQVMYLALELGEYVWTP